MLARKREVGWLRYLPSYIALFDQRLYRSRIFLEEQGKHKNPSRLKIVCGSRTLVVFVNRYSLKDSQPFFDSPSPSPMPYYLHLTFDEACIGRRLGDGW
jgi:hypothetical protein